jgi:hypothetical protein
VWNEVLESTSPHTLSQDQKKSLAQRWRELAKDLDHFAKQRERGSSNLSRTIEDEAAKLERRHTAAEVAGSKLYCISFMLCFAF